MSETTTQNYDEIAKMLKSVSDERNRAHKAGDEEQDVQVLGGLFEVSPTVANLMRIGYKGYLEKEISLGGSDWVRKNSQKLFESVATPEKAEKYAERASGVFGWGWLLAEPLVGVYNTVEKLALERKELSKKLEPLAVSHGEKAHRFGVGSYKNNEVVQHELDRIGTQFRRNFATDVIASSLNFVPNAILTKRAKDARLVKPDAATKEAPLINDKFMEGVVIPGGAILGNELKNSTNKKNNRFKNKASAFDKIHALSEEVEDRGAISSYKGKSLSDYIESIFQTHQEDMGRKPIGERYQEDLDYACDEIAKAISTGKLHPKALIDIVGDGMIVKHEGKSIASRAEVKDVMFKLCSKFPAHYEIDTDKYMTESAYTADDLKQLLEHMPPASKDVLASLVPDEVLKSMGWKADDIKAMHTRTEKTLARDLQAVVHDLAQMPDETLQGYKLQDKEIALLRKIDKEAQVKGSSAVLAAISTFGEFRKGIEWPVVNAKQYWEEIANGTRTMGKVTTTVNAESILQKSVNDGKLTDTDAHAILQNQAGYNGDYSEPQVTAFLKAHPEANDKVLETLQDKGLYHPHAAKSEQPKSFVERVGKSAPASALESAPARHAKHDAKDDSDKPMTKIHAALHHKTAAAHNASASHAHHA